MVGRDAELLRNLLNGVRWTTVGAQLVVQCPQQERPDTCRRRASTKKWWTMTDFGGNPRDHELQLRGDLKVNELAEDVRAAFLLAMEAWNFATDDRTAQMWMAAAEAAKQALMASENMEGIPSDLRRVVLVWGGTAAANAYNAGQPADERLTSHLDWASKGLEQYGFDDEGDDTCGPQARYIRGQMMGMVADDLLTQIHDERQQAPHARRRWWSRR